MKVPGTGGERAPFEWALRALFFLHPRRHRERYGTSQLKLYRDMRREVGGEEGFRTLPRLLAHVLWGLLCTAVKQRTSQIVHAVSTGNRLVVLGGLAVVVVGVGSLLEGIASYAWVRFFPSYPNLPARLPLGVLGEPMVVALLNAAGCAGLYAFIDRRFAPARAGLCMVGVSALLTLSLCFYDWVFDPAYYSGAGSGVTGAREVDRLAASVIETRDWVFALGTVCFALAASRSARLRRWWPLLLVLGFLQSPLFERCVFSLAGLLMGIQFDLIHAQAGSVWSEVAVVVFQLQAFLVFAPSIVPGFAWALFGALLVLKALFPRRGRHVTARRTRTVGGEQR